MKTIFKKLSAAFAALAVMAAAVTFDLSAKTASAASCGVDHTSAAKLTEELEQLTDGSYYLESNVTLSEEIVIPADATVTLCLNGKEIKAADNSRAFNVKNGGSLIICNCKSIGKITGGDVSTANDDSSESYGGAIYVDNGGSLTLNAGTISGGSANRGGGVCVSGGTFTMNGGTISTNTAIIKAAAFM